MTYSISMDITIEEYRRIIPKFLKLLNNQGYGKAKIISQMNFKKGDQILTYSNLLVAELLEKLETHRFESGKIKISHKDKEISLKRSPYTHDLTLELSLAPDKNLKAEVDTLFKAQKIGTPSEIAEKSKKASQAELKKQEEGKRKTWEKKH